MDSGKHAQQETVIRNKIEAFLMISVPIKYGKWQGTTASGSKIWDIK